MALISRTVPQINVMILGMPVKILIGIISFIFFDANYDKNYKLWYQ